KIPAKSSRIHKRSTLVLHSAREHWFRARMHDSARRVSKPGSSSPAHQFRVLTRRIEQPSVSERVFIMLTRITVVLACLVTVSLAGQQAKGAEAENLEAKVTELLSKDLTNLPGNKEGLMITVEYPPGSSDPIHRHNAHGFIYVLEGSIVMQV